MMLQIQESTVMLMAHIMPQSQVEQVLWNFRFTKAKIWPHGFKCQVQCWRLQYGLTIQIFGHHKFIWLAKNMFFILLREIKSISFALVHHGVTTLEDHILTWPMNHYGNMKILELLMQLIITSEVKAFWFIKLMEMQSEGQHKSTLLSLLQMDWKLLDKRFFFWEILYLLKLVLSRRLG